MSNIDTDFLTRASLLVSQINNEENLRALFSASLGLLKERQNSSPEEHLNAITEIAKKHKILK